MIIFTIITLSKGFFIKVLKSEDLEFTLFEEMSRKIRGISKRIAGNYALPSLDTVKTAKLRSINAGIISKKVKGLYIIGDVKSIMNYIESNFSVIE